MVSIIRRAYVIDAQIAATNPKLTVKYLLK